MYRLHEDKNVTNCSKTLDAPHANKPILIYMTNKALHLRRESAPKLWHSNHWASHWGEVMDGRFMNPTFREKGKHENSINTRA